MLSYDCWIPQTLKNATQFTAIYISKQIALQLLGADDNQSVHIWCTYSSPFIGIGILKFQTICYIYNERRNLLRK